MSRNEIIVCANGIRSRENEIIVRANGIRSRKNGLIIRANGIRSRENEIVYLFIYRHRGHLCHVINA